MLINPEQNAESLKIPKAIYLRILSKAVSQTQVDIKDIETALPFADFDKIQSISHRWKGDYDNMRLPVVAAIARQLNLEVKSGRDKDKIITFLNQFKEIFLQIEAELSALTNKT